MGQILGFFNVSVILVLGIWAFRDDNNKSPDLHIRKKRLIDRTFIGNRPVLLKDVPYIVNIQEDGVHICSGSILLANVILTTALCVIENLPHARYTIRSGSSLRDGGIRHQIVRIRRHPEFIIHNNSYSYSGDLALLTIFPPIDLIHSVNRKISLHNGTVSPNTVATTSGWGRVNIKGRTRPNELRSITVPTISLDQCRHEVRTYRELEFVQKLSDKFICTHDRLIEKHASLGDDGNPLVVHDHLIGVMIWTRDNGRPDVYVNLAHPSYKAWIVAELLQISTNPP